MPYKVFERDGKYCVYKHDAEGNAEGDTFGCHDTVEEANAQMAAIYANEKEIENPLALKAVNQEERIIEGYAATWDVDDEGETFDKSAFDSSLSHYMNRPVLLWQHGHDSEIGMNPIGRVIEAKVTELGLWVKAQIYKADKHADRAWNLIQQGVRHFSVGAIGSRVRKAGSHILEWPLVEISVEPFAANPQARFEIAKGMVAELAKAINVNETELTGEDMPKEAGTAEPVETPKLVTPQEEVKFVKSQEDTMTEEKKFDEQAIGNLVTDAVSKALAARAEAERKEKEQKDLQEKAIREEVEKRVAAEVAKNESRNIQFPAHASGIRVAGAYDHIPPSQLALGSMVMKSMGILPSTVYTRTMYDVIGKHVAAGALRNKEITPSSGAYKGMGMPAMFGIEGDAFVERALATKSAELMGSDVSTYGDEWVPVYFSRELIPLIRNEARVLGLFRQVEVQGESLTIPIQTGSVTWYKTAQTDDAEQLAWDNAFITARTSKASTNKITLTPAKLSALTLWSGELDEQSLVPMLPFLQAEMARSGAETIDNLLISGDETTTNKNISDYGNGSISTSWSLLLFDGLRHYPLVTDTTNARDAGALTAEDFLLTKKLMGTNGAYALDPSKLVWIFDPSLYWKVQSLGEALTLDKFGPGFTFGSGIIERVFGSPVIVSDQYGSTDSSGYINNTSNNNTLGQFMCVRPDQGIVGFGRRMKIETERIARSDAYSIVAHMMLDFKMATDEAVAMSYNVTVS